MHECNKVDCRTNDLLYPYCEECESDNNGRFDQGRSQFRNHRMRDEYFNSTTNEYDNSPSVIETALDIATDIIIADTVCDIISDIFD